MDTNQVYSMFSLMEKNSWIWSMSNSQLTPFCLQKRRNSSTCNLHTTIMGCKYFHTQFVRTKHVNHQILTCWRIPSKKQQLRSFWLSKLGRLSPATFLFCQILIEQTWNLSFCFLFFFVVMLQNWVTISYAFIINKTWKLLHMKKWGLTSI